MKSSAKKFSGLRRLAWTTAGRLLSKARYYNRANPYTAFKQLQGAHLLGGDVTQDVSDVLVVPIRVSSTSNLLEGLIGAGLKLDGHRVHALLDGGSLRYSENSNFGKSWLVSNALSTYEQAQFCGTYGILPCYFEDYIDEEKLRAERIRLSRLTYGQLLAYEFGGVRVGMHAKSGLMRYLRQETVDLPENTALLRQFVVTGVKTALAVQALLSEKPIRSAFISHAIYATWGVATDMLLNAGVKVTVWGRGYVGGNFILGRDKSYILESIDETIGDIRQVTAGRTEADEAVMRYFEEKAKPGSAVDLVSYYDEGGLIQSGKAERVAALTEGYKAVVCVFPNIPWDGTLFSASPYTPTMRAFARKVVLAAERFPDVKIIVRCHPAEKQRTGNQTRETFASFFTEADMRANPNLSILEPLCEISSYDLLPRCSAALTFGTTMALELAIRGIPVLQTGFFNLSHKNVVFEVTSDEMLIDLFEKIRKGALSMTEEMRENATIYADYHVNLRHIKDDMVEIKNYRFVRYKFTSVNKLGGENLMSCSAIKKFILGEIDRCVNPYV